MSLPIARCGAAKNLAATASFCAGPCYLIGFYVNSTAGGTLVLRDGGASGTALSGTITPVIGFHMFPAMIQASGHATIAVAGLDVTFFFTS